MTQTLEKLTTAHEVSNVLGIALPTVYAWIKKEDDPMPHRKIGKAIRFKLSEVYAWADRH